MRAIFMSYRRDDTEGQAGRLFDDLTQQFGSDTVFMDVAAIEAGRDFRRVIDEQVASCGVLLAIIGKNWLIAENESRARRLDDTMDFVRLEIASALKRDIPVVPVLVQGAKMPRADDLPDDLKDLAFRNGVELTHARWDSDVQVLVKALRPHVRSNEEPKPPATSQAGKPRMGLFRSVSVASVCMLLLALGVLLWRQNVPEEDSVDGVTIAADESATQQAGKAGGAETAKVDLADKEAVPQDKTKENAALETQDVRGYWQGDDDVLYRIVSDQYGNYDMGRIKPPEDSGVYRKVHINGREVEIAIGSLPSGSQHAVANLQLSVDGNVMAGLRQLIQGEEELPTNWTLKRVDGY